MLEDPIYPNLPFSERKGGRDTDMNLVGYITMCFMLAAVLIALASERHTEAAIVMLGILGCVLYPARQGLFGNIQEPEQLENSTARESSASEAVEIAKPGANSNFR